MSSRAKIHVTRGVLSISATFRSIIRILRDSNSKTFYFLPMYQKKDHFEYIKNKRSYILRNKL